MPTKIQWADEVWNPIRGCSRVSIGCRNCYAERMAARFSDPGYWGHGYAERTPHGGMWTGEIGFVENKLDLPRSWRKPRRVFVNSTSDLFHEKVRWTWLSRIFGVMAECPQHTFLMLTKRPERMRAYFDTMALAPPTKNVWLGVSAEDLLRADERIPLLLDTPAAIRWVSAEPLLGFVDLWRYIRDLDWVVVGAESGPGARPMDIDWVRSLRDLCSAARVPFFYKQRMLDGQKVSMPRLDGRVWAEYPRSNNASA